MKPMLAHNYDKHAHKMPWPCFVSPKLDGTRAIFKNGKFISRGGKTWNDPVVRHLVDELSPWASDIILDGEFYVHGWPRQRINGAMAAKRLEPNDDTPQVQYHIFDIIRPGSFQMRYDWLKDRFHKTKSVKLVSQHYVSEKSEADELYSDYVARGFEGLMYRNPRTEYTKGRTYTLLKRKDFGECEATIMDFVEGEGKHEGRLGALICELDNGGKVRVGSGFTDELREMIWDAPMEYQEQLITIRYHALSSEDIPLEPRFIGFRDDL